MAENCKIVDSLGTEICTYQLQGTNEVVGSEQKLFIYPQQALDRCTSGGETTSTAEADAIRAEITALNQDMVSAEATLEQYQASYNELNSTVAYINGLVAEWGSVSEWLTSQIESYQSQYTNGSIDSDTYNYWFSSYTTQNNYVISVILDIMEEHDYSNLVSQRNEQYALVSEAFYKLYYFNENPTNQMQIDDLNERLAEIESVVSDDSEVDFRCLLDDSATPITVFDMRGLSVGQNIMLDVIFSHEMYTVPFMIGEIEPTVINIMGRDEEFDILHGHYGEYTNLFEYLEDRSPILGSMDFRMADKELVTIKIKR
tara:strand:- start:2800 stop:3744 length:945 start_codon:yes stop_codon:yes gene_type:complete